MHSLTSVQRSYGTYDADYEMIQTDNEDLEEAATRDPKADKSKSRETESGKEAEKSERAKMKPRQEKRKRTSRPRDEENRKTEWRLSKRTRLSAAESTLRKKFKKSDHEERYSLH